MNNGVVLKVINKESDGTISKFTLLKYETNERAFLKEEFYILQDNNGDVIAVAAVYEEDREGMVGRGIVLDYYYEVSEDALKNLLLCVLEFKDGWNSFIRLNQEFMEDYGKVEEDWLGDRRVKFL